MLDQPDSTAWLPKESFHAKSLSLYLLMALGLKDGLALDVTFPLNILFGIPLYTRMAKYFLG